MVGSPPVNSMTFTPKSSNFLRMRFVICLHFVSENDCRQENEYQKDYHQNPSHSDHLSSPYQTLYGFQVLAVPKSSLEAHFQHQILSSSKQFDFLGYNYKEVIENERY
jgi:hypothetical protein